MRILRLSKIIAIGITLSFAVAISPAFTAQIAGSKCTKSGSTKIVSNIKYTCVKQGSKLVWNKGVAIKKPVLKPNPSITQTSDPTPSSSPTPSQTPSQTPLPKEGDECGLMGLRVNSSAGLLECRHFANNKLFFVTITNNFMPLSNPTSPENSTFCRLPDMRAVIPPNTYSIAYPPKPFSNYTPTGTFKIVVVGIDFPDVPGNGSPSEIWKDDIEKTKQWLKWYTNDKVKFDFVTYTQWFRAPKSSENYDTTNHGTKGPGDVQVGGLSGQQIADDYVHAIEDIADLSHVNTIWFYFPKDIKKIVGQWTQQTSHVQTKKFGIITPQLVAVGADTYLSRRVRWGYFLHEMIHGFGLQGHSPKYLPANGFTRIGIMSTADGWTNALLPWDAMTWGVDKPEDTYCVDSNKLKSIDLKLVPLEREQEGFRSVMVKLNDHQVLLVESHRSDKWGVGEGQGFAGVMVSLIDTTISTSWDDDKTAKDPATTSTGTYLLVDGANHGNHKPIGAEIFNDGVIYRGPGLVNGDGIAGDYEYWDLNHIMYIGESVTKYGIKVSLISGGDNDTVRIEKV